MGASPFLLQSSSVSSHSRVTMVGEPRRVYAPFKGELGGVRSRNGRGDSMARGVGVRVRCEQRNEIVTL